MAMLTTPARSHRHPASAPKHQRLQPDGPGHRVEASGEMPGLVGESSTQEGENATTTRDDRHPAALRDGVLSSAAPAATATTTKQAPGTPGR